MATALTLFAAACRIFGASVEAQWVSRELGWLPAADYLSREAGRQRQAEWAFARHDATALARDFFGAPPRVDVFATRANRVADQFCSRYPEAGSLGNALDTQWGPDAWAFPPFLTAATAAAHWLRGPRPRTLWILREESPAAAMLEAAGVVVRRRVVPSRYHLVDPQGVAAPARGRPKLLAVLTMATRRR